MTDPAEQKTHEEVDGEILPPDPVGLHDIDPNDPNAARFEPFRNRDKLSPDHAPYAETEEDKNKPTAGVGLFVVGSTVPKIPKDVRGIIDATRANLPPATPRSPNTRNTVVNQYRNGNLS